MIRISPELQRRSLIPLIAAALGAGYFFVFMPLGRKADKLDAPLEQSWRKLAALLGQTNVTKLDFTALTNQFAETRIALAALESARQEAQARVEVGEELRARLEAPFQLVEYAGEANRRKGDLARLAKQQQVAMDPAVFDGFPEQTADLKSPALLWAELSFIDALLTAAINARVTAIHSLTAPLPLTTAPPTNGLRILAELPVQVELTGPAPNVAKFLQTLPLRTEEIRAAGLPDVPTNKPALFIDRLVLRKQTPEKQDEVRLTLRASGFVFRP